MRERSMFLHSVEQKNHFDQEIRRISYQKDGIEASYPEFISGGTKEQRAIWNDLIRKDFEQIIQIYSVNPFPGRTNSLTRKDTIRLNLDYEIKSNSNNIFSLLYTAKYFSPYSAYPTDLVYTTNIDKRNNKRLRLPDMVEVDTNFVKNFRSWELARSKDSGYKFLDVVKTYRNSLSDDDLLKGFLAADQISPKNLWQVYSYITPQNLGISIYAPNYIGDHVEFERTLSKLQGYLKPDFVFS